MSSSPPSNGKVRPITRWGTPILHRSVRELKSSELGTPDLDTLIADMFATMYAAGGVGLAANQVGVDLKLFVYDLTDKGTRSWGIVCNPVVETHKAPVTGGTKQGQHPTEGCLSYPGINASVVRPRSITVRGLDQHGKAIEFHAEGLLAQILQHENDHLNGVVYGDHVPREVRDKMDSKYEELERRKAYPDNWPVSKTTHQWGS
ncbi:hypothetical protein H2200_004289 [Cladophialophora chaetospira]|uniref:Peptide deformylase n=1 Tax=Cladophialophora chaetospira TaxID=386627 RepID=A0AA38XCU3_9EURO|nr:hypothetical protein H2200_004289 [Cladophialophora chaetospira]